MARASVARPEALFGRVCKGSWSHHAGARSSVLARKLKVELVLSLFTLICGEIPPRRRVKRHKTASARPTFTHLLDSIAAQASNHNVGDLRDVTVRDIVAAVGSRSYGALLLLLGVVSISPLTVLPGANWLVATITLLVALQMTFSARHLWLPSTLLDVRIHRASIEDAVARLHRVAHTLDALLKPRPTVLVEKPSTSLAGLFCAVAALATFPLGLVPLGPVVPGLAISTIGLGLFFKDGLIVLVGASIVAGAAALAYHLIS